MKILTIIMALLELLLSMYTIIAAMALPFEPLTSKIKTAVVSNSLSNIKPIHYHLNFKLPIENDIYHGESNISIEIYEKMQDIKLHSANLIITNIILINKDFLNSKNNKTQFVHVPLRYSYLHERNIFVMYFNNVILPGNYNLNIRFLGKTTNNTKGLFRTSYINEKGSTTWLFATYLLTTGARYFFPCWDDPKLEAYFSISVKHPEAYRALSNMPIQQRHKLENNMTWTYFDTTPLISPNSVAVAIIDFPDMYSLDKMINENNVFNKWNVKIWFRDQKKRESLGYMLFQYFVSHVENYWNMFSSKVTSKVDYVVIPNLPIKALTSPGLVLHREADFFFEPNRQVEIMSQINLEFLIMNNIMEGTLYNIPSLVMRGFIKFAGIQVIDKIISIPKMDLFVVQNQHESFRFNFYYSNISQSNKSFNIDSLSSQFYYGKVFSIFRMLQHLITNERFQSGMQAYLKTNFITTFEEFWKNFHIFFDKDNEYERMDLKGRMQGWSQHESYPILKVICNYVDHIHISLQNFNLNGSDLWIPMTYTTQKNPDFNKTLIRDVTWLKFTSQNPFVIIYKNIEINNWFIINLQQTGYYRVNYDAQNWKNIAKYLNSNEYMKIHVINRAQIIDDAYHFLKNREIDSSIFWEITNYLSHEIDFVPWYPMIKALEDMSSVFPLSDKRVYNIKEKMQNIFNQLLRRIKYFEEDNTDYRNCLRQEARNWACILDEFICKTVAADLLKQKLVNHTENKFSPWWEEWAYCNGLSMLDNNYWDNVFDTYTQELDEKYLKYLACSKNIDIIKNYINLVMDRDLNDRDYVNSWHFILAKHARNSIILDYVLANFDKINPRQIKVAILIDIINHIYSKEQLHKILLFARDGLRELVMDVELKIKIRSSQIKNQMDYLYIFI